MTTRMIWATAALLAACESTVESPTPSLYDASPGLVCPEQLVQEVVVTGAGLAPAPVDALSDEPALTLPTLWLEQSSTLSGEALDGAGVRIDVANPDWRSPATMAFSTGPEQGLEPGIYDLYVAALDGQTSGLHAALSVVSAPSFTARTPGLACLDEARHEVSVTGDGFLVVGESLPTVSFGETAFEAVAARGCYGIASAIDAEICEELTVGLPAGGLSAENHVLMVENPAPASCATPEPLQFEVIAAPVLESVAPALTCAVQSERVLTLVGSGFLRTADGALPTAVVGSHSAVVDEVSDCVALDGDDGGEVCSTLTLTVPAAAVSDGVQAVSVTNPAPAACATTARHWVEFVGAPSIESVLPEPQCTTQGDREMTVRGEGFLVLDDGTLPVVSLGTTDVPVTGVAACTSLAGPEGGQVCRELTVLLEDSLHAAGVVDAVVRNPGDGDCVSSESVPVELVAPPVLTDIEESLVCDAQDTNRFTLTGEGFLVTREGMLPTVTLGTYVAEAASASDCTERTGSAGGQVCRVLVVDLPVGAIGAGVHAAVVTNPGPASCQSSETVEFESVDAPVVAGVEESLVCTAEGDNLIAIDGTGFLVLSDGTLPTVSIGGVSVVVSAAQNCTPLTGPAGGETCAQLDVVLAQGALTAGLHDVRVHNPSPADCQSDASVQLEVIGEPVVASVEPELSCGDDGATAYMLTGGDFLVSASGDLPTVTIGTWTGAVDSVDDCVAASGGSGAQVCASAEVTLPSGTLSAGVHTVVLSNPAPASCESNEVVSVETVPAPTLVGLTDALVCAEQSDRTVWLQGTGLVVAPDGTKPTVLLGTTALTVSDTAGCTALSGPAGGQSCSELEVVIPAGVVSTGVHAVSVTNPAPVECVASATLEVELVSDPVVTSVSEELACGTQSDTTVTLEGADFLVSQYGDLPVVSVGGWVGGAASASGCTSLTGPDGGEVCSELVVTLPVGSVTSGVHDISVVNPDPGACQTTAPVQFEMVDPPSVVDVTPPDTCGGLDDEALVADGSGFLVLADGTQPTVTMGGVAYSPDSLSGCTALAGPAGGQICSELAFTYAGGDLGVGTYDLVVENPGLGACESMEAVVFGIAEPPTITGVSPEATCPTGGTISVLGSGFTAGTQVTIGGLAAASTRFVSGTELEVEVPAGLPTNTYQDVVVSNTGCGSDTLAGGLYISGVPSVFYVDPPVVYTGIQIEATAYISSVDTVARVWLEEAATGLITTVAYSHSTGANQVDFTIPSGLSEGDYNVYMTNAYGCSASLEGAFFAEADLTVSVDDVEPSMGWTGTATPVEVTGSGFVDIPRLYLNPSTAGSAAGLSSVRYRNSASLNAVIPAGVTPDVYDLIVINPDGTIGLLTGAFEVTADPVPVVDAVAPASVSTSDGSITITGSEFRTPTVEIQCVEASTGAESTAAASVSTSSSTTITATIPSSSYSNGDVCVVRVTNSDGTYTDYSAISITTPAYNLYGFVTGPSMNAGRRSAAAAAGRATSAERYIYAFGGDSGSTAGALSSVECVDIDQFGSMGSWRILEENELPTPLTQAGIAVIGRFVYLVGGHDSASPTTAVWRAQVLDPQETPSFAGLEMDYGDGVNGLGEGTWIYRVAALYPSTYDTNPDGQSLASDPIVVNVPAVPDLIELTIQWSAVDDASGYRIFRTPTAGSGSGAEEWVADVSGGSTLEYTDTGATTDAAVVPLEDGSLGTWFEVASLLTSRQAPGVGVGVDPADDSIHYIYAAGGLDAAGLATDTIEYLRIEEVDEHQHVVDASWTSSVNVMDEPRSLLGVWSVDSGLNPSVTPGESWIYIGGGLPTGARTKTIMAGEVSVGGELTTFGVVASLNKARAGFGVAVSSDQLYAFGGHNGAPNATSDSCELDAAGPPAIGTCNAGATLNDARYMLGATQESAHIYVVGGDLGSGKGSTSVEYGPW